MSKHGNLVSQKSMPLRRSFLSLFAFMRQYSLLMSKDTHTFDDVIQHRSL